MFAFFNFIWNFYVILFSSRQYIYINVYVCIYIYRAYDIDVVKGECKIRGESDKRGCTEEKATHLSQTYLNIPGIDTNPF